MENDQCCGNCKWQRVGSCTRHHAFIRKEDLNSFTCDDYIPESQMDLEEFDNQMRIAEIERR